MTADAIVARQIRKLSDMALAALWDDPDQETRDTANAVSHYRAEAYALNQEMREINAEPAGNSRR